MSCDIIFLNEQGEAKAGKGRNRMKIVVLDGYTENPGDLSWAELEKLGNVTVYDRTSLTDDDVAREDCFAAVLLDTEVLRV